MQAIVYAAFKALCKLQKKKKSKQEMQRVRKFHTVKRTVNTSFSIVSKKGLLEALKKFGPQFFLMLTICPRLILMSLHGLPPRLLNPLTI